MQRMRGAGRDIGVTQRCRQSFLRDRRKVVSVDEIMSDARMIGMLGELGIEDCGRFERSRIGLAAQRLACDERPHRRWTKSADGLASTGLAAGRAWPPIVEYCLAT